MKSRFLRTKVTFGPKAQHFGVRATPKDLFEAPKFWTKVGACP